MPRAANIGYRHGFDPRRNLREEFNTPMTEGVLNKNVEEASQAVDTVLKVLEQPIEQLVGRFYAGEIDKDGLTAGCTSLIADYESAHPEVDSMALDIIREAVLPGFIDEVFAAAKKGRRNRRRTSRRTSSRKSTRKSTRKSH